jgi:hypothetical protein
MASFLFTFVTASGHLFDDIPETKRRIGVPSYTRHVYDLCVQWVRG